MSSEPAAAAGSTPDIETRSDHQQIIDALTDRYLEDYQDSRWDLALREVEYFYSEENSPGERDELYGHPKGELDFGLVDLDRQEIVYHEVKSSRKYMEDGLEQIERLEETVENLNEHLDSEWDVDGEVVTPEEIDLEGLDPSDYGDAVYCSRETANRLRSSDPFSEISSHLFDDEIPLEDAPALERQVEELYAS
ncbi:MAG: hypothetical protein ABEK01_00990 [Candidatus Nanohaloarchaea archaeon]